MIDPTISELIKRIEVIENRLLSSAPTTTNWRGQTKQVEALDPATGEVVKIYPSIQSTMHDGYNPTTVSQVADHPMRTHHGLRWRRVKPEPTSDIDEKPEVEQDFVRVERFIADHVCVAPGHLLPFGEFYGRFLEWLPSEERHDWSRIRVSQSLPVRHPSGQGAGNVTFVINAAWEPKSAEVPYRINSRGRVYRS